MNKHDPNKNDAAPTGAEMRVSTLVGDRFCIRCGYNLTGQPVLREPHYDMLIVRCPECATVASVQEYPLLGRWASRWAALLAAIWFIVCVGLLVGTAGVMFGVSEGIAQSSWQDYATWLSEQQLEWLKQQQAAGNTLTPPQQSLLTQPPWGYVQTDKAWMTAQTPADLLAKAGGWRQAADWSALLHWLWVPLVIVPFGCIWAIVMMRLQWRGLLLLSLGPATLAAVFVWINVLDDAMRSAYGRWWSMSALAEEQLGWRFAAMTLAFAMLPLAGGMICGRPLVRLLIRALLPPRLRSSLALLWIADGLEPPRAGGKVTRDERRATSDE